MAFEFKLPDIGEGVVGAPLSKYDRFHTRICRPIGLTADVLSEATAVDEGRWQAALRLVQRARRHPRHELAMAAATNTTANRSVSTSSVPSGAPLATDARYHPVTDSPSTPPATASDRV